VFTQTIHNKMDRTSNGTTAAEPTGKQIGNISGPLADLGPAEAKGDNATPSLASYTDRAGGPATEEALAAHARRVAALGAEPPSVAIIGAGWYGCHIAKALKARGAKVTVFEQGPDLFVGSSAKNQFRLHLGFHYPRSYPTRMQIKTSFDRFQVEYPEFFIDVDTNVYAGTYWRRGVYVFHMCVVVRTTRLLLHT
jgi:hypothetical protein